MNSRFLLLSVLGLISCAQPAPERCVPAGSAVAAGAPPPASASSGSSASDASAMKAELSFIRDAKRLGVMTRAELEAAVPPEVWTAFDPYYNKPKTYRALKLTSVLMKGFHEPVEELAKHDYVLRAADGYTVPISGSKVVEAGAYIAVADLDVPGWEPIGQGRANPGPYYLVWKEANQGLDTHPRPWQLASIEIAPFESTFPHIAPSGAKADAPEMRGYRLFRDQCITCHAINREGGRVGPDLNVPQNIVEYRPEAQIRAYIKDPTTFRYSNMPAHPAFGDEDLDALVAYFKAMKSKKSDPDAKAKGGH